MYHNLKSLYDLTKRFYPELVKQFTDLEDYCNENKKINRTGYNSLKWIVFTLRDHLTPEEMKTTFYYLLAECQNREADLYNNVMNTKTYFLNKKYLKGEQ